MSNATPRGRSALLLQAKGMVSVQAACTMDAALVLMQEHGDATHSNLDEIADSVVERRVRFGT